MLTVRTALLGHGRKGVTLTEVVVASTLLAVAVVPLLRTLTVAQATSMVIERKTQCLILAEARLEEIRARAAHYYGDSFRKDSEKLVDAYLCHVTDDQDPDLRLVTVSVGYDLDSNGQLSDSEVEVTLATYVAKRQ